VYKIVKIGDLRITLFALIAAVCGIISGLYASYIYSGVSDTFGIILGLVTIGVSFLTAYNLNCVIVGHCKVWAWILVSVYVLNTLLMFIPITVKKSRK
jgi:hypothetical protein